jgi:hypothetical protein
MTNSPTSRNWEHVSNILADNYPPSLHRRLFCGAIGEEEGHAFNSFLSRINDLVYPDSIIANPDTADIPSQPDVMWSVLTALAGRVDKKNFPAIGKYADRLSGEWSTYLITDCVRKHSELLKTGTYVNWALKHGEIQI